MIPKWYRQISTFFQLTGLVVISASKEKCENTILQIKPETVEFKSIPGLITLDDQQKFSLTSILVPTDLKDEGENPDLQECTENSYVKVNNYFYTISLSFHDNIPPSSAFLLSSLTGHVIEVSDDKKELIIHRCGNEEENISFYEEYLDYNRTTSNRINIMFLLNNDYLALMSDLEVQGITIELYSVNNHSCLVSGYFKILKEDLESTDDGEIFIPYLELPSRNTDQLVKVYFREKIPTDTFLQGGPS